MHTFHYQTCALIILQAISALHGSEIPRSAYIAAESPDSPREHKAAPPDKVSIILARQDAPPLERLKLYTDTLTQNSDHDTIHELSKTFLVSLAGLLAHERRVAPQSCSCADQERLAERWTPNADSAIQSLQSMGITSKNTRRYAVLARDTGRKVVTEFLDAAWNNRYLVQHAARMRAVHILMTTTTTPFNLPLSHADGLFDVPDNLELAGWVLREIRINHNAKYTRLTKTSRVNIRKVSTFVHHALQHQGHAEAVLQSIITHSPPGPIPSREQAATWAKLSTEEIAHANRFLSEARLAGLCKA